MSNKQKILGIVLFLSIYSCQAGVDFTAKPAETKKVEVHTALQAEPSAPMPPKSPYEIEGFIGSKYARIVVESNKGGVIRGRLFVQDSPSLFVQGKKVNNVIHLYDSESNHFTIIPKATRPMDKIKPIFDIGLEIKFAYDSDVILDESKPLLKKIGEILILPAFMSKNIIIEGHTDALGSDQYNRQLSEQRATSVKHYLEKMFRTIAKGRLIPIGIGENQPIEGIDPYDVKQRRVVLRQVN